MDHCDHLVEVEVVGVGAEVGVEGVVVEGEWVAYLPEVCLN